MFDRPAVAHGSEGLNPEQRQLLRLNVDFLKLLIESDRNSAVNAASRAQLNLPPAQSAQLIQCPEEGLQRMAACGFSLFSLSMHRADLWQRAASGGTQINPQYAWSGSANGDARSGFMACALFFAWHLTQQAPRTARFLLGMSDDCAAVVTGLELWQCGHIAQTHGHLLSPRWQHHPYFWTDLLRYGSTGDAQHMKFARLLGSQLMAQELEPSAIVRLSSTE
jgi:hypothetical protein